MTPEEAIRTAIKYEKKVTALYVEAVDATEDKGARKFFQLMADEEKSHVDFLEAKLSEWQDDENLTSTGIDTVLPSPDMLKDGLSRLKKTMGKDRTESYGAEVAMLKKALEAEEETSEFYRSLADTLPEKLQEVFRRFIEIEDGHRAAVEAELDAVEGNSFWFNVQEFNLES